MSQGNSSTSAEPASLEWVRAPRQERTRQSLERILDAAESMLAERSFEDISIAELASRAESSVGGFYRRFSDKEGLLHALHERFCEDARATADVALSAERWQGAPVAEIIDAFTTFLVRIYRDKEGMLRSFLHRGVADPIVRERNDRLNEHLSNNLVALLADRSGEIAHDDPRTAVTFGLYVILGTLVEAILIRPSMISIDDRRFEAELSRVFSTYLGVVSK